jgi:hypothetical protein
LGLKPNSTSVGTPPVYHAEDINSFISYLHGRPVWPPSRDGEGAFFCTLRLKAKIVEHFLAVGNLRIGKSTIDHSTAGNGLFTTKVVVMGN